MNGLKRIPVWCRVLLLTAVVAVAFSHLPAGGWGSVSRDTGGCPTAFAAGEGMPGHTLRDANAEKRHAAEAVLDDGNDIYHSSVSRVQRTIQSLTAKNSRCAIRQIHAYKYNRQVHLHYGGKVILESAPFRGQAQCDYYVFALRRLLC